MELILRAIIVGALASGAGWLFEHGLAHLRMGRRYAWTFALLATLVLPLLPRMFEASPTSVVPQLMAPAVVISAGSSFQSQFDVDFARLAWISLSLVVLLFFLISYLRLQRERRAWRAARLADNEVLMSQRFGPAVFGFVAPKIVVPEWVQATSQEEQRLIVLHEREHIRAGDQLQLLLSIAATIAMPWNPFVWLQSRRLRFTIEADCDQRVLAAAPDAARYASLLVDVGSRQTGLLLTPALAEHRNGLERRLVMMATKLIENRWKAAGLMVVGLLVTAVACESRLPNDPQAPTPQGDVTQASFPRMKQEGTTPHRMNIPELVEKYYPPVLKDAGIGGRVGIKMNVRASGAVDGHEIFHSSGHEALDQAALRVMREAEILPARVPAGQQVKDQVVQYVLEFDTKGATVQTRTRALLGDPSSRKAPDTTRSTRRR